MSYDGSGGEGFTDPTGRHKIGTSWLTLAQLQALPTDSVALANILAANPSADQGSRAYAIADGVADLLTSPVPAAVQTAGYQLLSQTPGITVVGPVTIGPVSGPGQVRGQEFDVDGLPVDPGTPAPGVTAAMPTSLDVHFVFSRTTP